MDLTQLKKQIELKKQNYPQEWLGRSLAYTPYQPRPIKEILTKTKQYYPKNIYSIPNTKDFLEFSQNKEKEASCFLLDILENLTFVRRYTYQILESLVFGADCIILTPSILSQKNLKELSDFAIKIGLERIFTINSKEDLSKAIFAKADILNLQNNSNLIPLIPQNKIILAQKNLQKIQGIDTYIEDF